MLVLPPLPPLPVRKRHWCEQNWRTEMQTVLHGQGRCPHWSTPMATVL
jgi:hypothetical protein